MTEKVHDDKLQEEDNQRIVKEFKDKLNQINDVNISRTLA